jgi:hypothetical protein
LARCFIMCCKPKINQVQQQLYLFTFSLHMLFCVMIAWCPAGSAVFGKAGTLDCVLGQDWTQHQLTQLQLTGFEPLLAHLTHHRPTISDLPSSLLKCRQATAYMSVYNNSSTEM